MYQSSPFIPRKKQMDRDFLRDKIIIELRQIQLKNQPMVSKQQIADIISPEEFNLLRNFLDKPKLNVYLPQFIKNHLNINQLIADIKKINFVIEDAHREENAYSLIQAASDESSTFNQSLVDEFSHAWDGTTAKTNFDKAKVLLDMYLGSGYSITMFLRENFRTETLGRQHFSNIKELRDKCDRQEIKNIYHLLSALGEIKIKNQQGHLQAIITVIIRKLNEEEQKQIGSEQGSRRGSSSLSFHPR